MSDVQEIKRALKEFLVDEEDGIEKYYILINFVREADIDVVKKKVLLKKLLEITGDESYHKGILRALLKML